MSWKAIGQSVAGTSHIATGRVCDDAIRYEVARNESVGEALICCASDGAGSALYAAWAADFVTHYIVSALTAFAEEGRTVSEAEVLGLVEELYDALEEESGVQGVDINEYSCTLLGCYLTADRSVFFQVGDGAIVRNDGADNYTHIWWPQNGEYQNTTSFIVDDSALGNLNIIILEERIDEVAIFTDGLQMLALNVETMSAHGPFFTDLFRYLRMADDNHKVGVLNKKLAEYLDSRQINERTDDDKTLFLATRL